MVVMEVLQMAISQQRPALGLLFHSDGGSNTAAPLLRKRSKINK